MKKCKLCSSMTESRYAYCGSHKAIGTAQVYIDRIIEGQNGMAQPKFIQQFLHSWMTAGLIVWVNEGWKLTETGLEAKNATV